jgi:16S rRNA (cytosine967-C5)-methyltransferase
MARARSGRSSEPSPPLLPESASAERSGERARRLAWEILLAVERGRFADAELGRRLPRSSLDDRDHALVTRLVYGTLTWQGWLDHLIQQCARPPDRIDAPLRVLLRLALYQLAKLSRIPDFAAVDTAVALAKNFRRGAASGFVNAVLRRFLRQGDRLRKPDPRSDRAEELALAFSHPRWLVEQWLEELGPTEARALLAANNEPAPTVLRVNRLRAGRDSLLASFTKAGLSAAPARFAPHGIVVEPGGDPARLPGFSEGLFSMQGEASQLVTLLLGARRGQRVWDACAAPGGKSTYLGELLHDDGTVLATDTSTSGVQDIRAGARRLGITCIQARHADAARNPHPHGGVGFDAILVDAPCSGLGTLRQHPEIRWRRRPKEIAALAKRQSRLLDAVLPRLAPGGALVYATCTIARAENEQVVAEFLERHRRLRIADPRPFLPQAAHPFVDAEGMFRTFPHRGGLDGFFAVRLCSSAAPESLALI